MTDGVCLVVDAPLDDVEQALEVALANGGVLRITLGDDSTIVINAAQVLYLQAEGASNPDHSPVETRRLVEQAAG
jgi:hypothetical protein